ncbi:hypothetical protein C5167_015312 [Papaver somniferum]|uniref:Uncharacterized protein n=1 Tax=Papaver somniferum TaxID=3469 RepID=A0A4Y7J954_PAPSO|nr:hypothetical protein C5167_015312 [Papaver somniferum]
MEPPKPKTKQGYWCNSSYLPMRWKDYAKVPRTEKLGKAGLVREKSFGTRAVTIITCDGRVGQ